MVVLRVCYNCIRNEHSRCLGAEPARGSTPENPVLGGSVCICPVCAAEARAKQMEDLKRQLGLSDIEFCFGSSPPKPWPERTRRELQTTKTVRRRRKK